MNLNHIQKLERKKKEKEDGQEWKWTRPVEKKNKVAFYV